jgi:hypothetical protein
MKISKRDILIAGATVTASAVILKNQIADDSRLYDNSVRNIWRPTSSRLSEASQIHRELVRLATLAPSSHNTQCWKFVSQIDKSQSISIIPDFSRRCPSVDPDDHHIFVSLGCATENLMQAALANGLKSEARFDQPSGILKIDFKPTDSFASPLYQAIPKRQSTRAEFDGKALSNEELQLLERAGKGPGVGLLIFTEKPRLEQILDFVIQGNTAQINDAKFVAELKSWIRFSDSEAVRKGDGLFSRASGSPSVPRWLASPLFPLFFNVKGETEKYVKQMRSSAGVAVFVSDKSDQSHWLEAGRCFERFTLQATALGIRTSLLNQPVEVTSLRPAFASLIGVKGQRPDLVVRFGRGPEMPRSLRRPLEDVLKLPHP